MEVLAMYRGNQLLYVGTIDEIAKQHGVKRSTIMQYKTPSYKKVVAKRKNPEKCITLIKLEND